MEPRLRGDASGAFYAPRRYATPLISPVISGEVRGAWSSSTKQKKKLQVEEGGSIFHVVLVSKYQRAREETMNQADPNESEADPRPADPHAPPPVPARVCQTRRDYNDKDAATRGPVLGTKSSRAASRTEAGLRQRPGPKVRPARGWKSRCSSCLTLTLCVSEPSRAASLLPDSWCRSAAQRGATKSCLLRGTRDLLLPPDPRGSGSGSGFAQASSKSHKTSYFYLPRLCAAESLKTRFSREHTKPQGFSKPAPPPRARQSNLVKPCWVLSVWGSADPAAC